MNIFEKYLTVWVFLCMVLGVVLGVFASGFAETLDNAAVFVGEGESRVPVVSIPIGICLFFMMYPIMVKIDFWQVAKTARNWKAVLFTVVINWAIKPFTMYGWALLFLGYVFRDAIGDGTETVKVPFGANVKAGDAYGDGTIVLTPEGRLGLEVPLWRSYVAGCILLGVAPCTAMVLVWSNLAKGNDGLTLIMVAVNSVLMLLLFGLIGGALLQMGQLPVPWEALLLSISVYVVFPLVTGIFSRWLIFRLMGREWFEKTFLRILTPVTIIALLLTLVVLFSLQGKTIVRNPLTILMIAVPLLIQTVTIFLIGYVAARLLRFAYEEAAPSAMIGASNHFEVAIATAAMLYGLNSGASTATVVGVLIEVPLMLCLVQTCLWTKGWFPHAWPEEEKEKTGDAVDSMDSEGTRQNARRPTIPADTDEGASAGV
uniref:Arsenical-resistance protein n=1 Tax=Chromera velia CCMP2878 TaxID=1169474 RepID=A0A0G4HN09_9ALVE|mmetsp:Transcript_42473/g.83722  ORF Transcript_42473/g.83722 Transcript_42473/m.83722 type:complete len:429 (-) Transcript_42473:1746-3032(-)|eukprot:Cvel_29278.t1-p1 / transcript=Cvel_29278.t1 / gene=Cvel_29278 / organism=Chromera_velia_CCMP2878 / gene_product=Uncharacterized transporter slr0944, putative / transcript_product=Uncharacterized transporter slr0944, putative / location=Cvel_scaffold3976:8713-10219(+) / protein_length=428 / sequence_SO=supercontig / SO=protein_coding / is_pseudo=false